MGSIGPFPSFVFPGVFTQTLNEAPQASAAGGLRVPAFIGVADEVIPVVSYEMVRGSSSMADNKIVKEEIISNMTYPIDGINRSFLVTYFPITTGAGNGITSNNVNDVVAYVNGTSVPVSAVVGVTGVVSLMTPPADGDLVEISYYFKKYDTKHTNEDLSVQVATGNTVFKVDYLPIVQGNNGGITSTDPATVIVKVNGFPVTVSAVDGESGQITLAAAPTGGSTVLVTYFSNDYQDTSDILPSHNVSEITKVGLSTSTKDFSEIADYVLDTSGSFNTLNWGNSYKIVRGSHTSGYTYFYDQVTATLFDNRIYRQAAGTTDGTKTTFILPGTPTSGTGQGKTTDNPALIAAYYGTSPADASAAVVIEMSGTTNPATFTLATAPAAGQTVYVTEYQNKLTDDTWTLTDTTSGAVGTGTYSLVGTDSGVAMDVTWDPTGTNVNSNVGNTTIPYPDGVGALNRDTQVLPGYAVQETVTISFIDSKSYGVTSDNPNGTGTGASNTGYINQTYIDSVTGFRVTLVAPQAPYAYDPGDTITYKVSPQFITSAIATRAIPGVKLYVSDTSGIFVTDTGIITTYNKTGNEPNIGDYYYVTFNDNKSFDVNGLINPIFVTTEKNALAYTGPLGVSNKLALAAHLAFLNGAPGVILLQIQKTVNGTEAPYNTYVKAIDVFTNPMQGGLRPSLMEPVTTMTNVLTYTKTSNIIQSSIRYANERMTYFGFPVNTTPSQAQALAQSYNSERMTGLYPDGAVVTLTDELGNDIEYLVDGSILAAAVCGRDTSPAYDVAEPLTRKPLVGFNRLYRRLDTVTQSQVANSGLTILEEQPSEILVKIDLTTDTTSVLTRTPSVIRIKDFVQKGTRNILMPFIGSKFLPSRKTEIEKTLKSYLSSLVKAQIITAFTDVTAVPDANDPTTIQVTASYSPVLPLLWIVVTFNLRARI